MYATTHYQNLLLNFLATDLVTSTFPSLKKVSLKFSYGFFFSDGISDGVNLDADLQWVDYPSLMSDGFNPIADQ